MTMQAPHQISLNQEVLFQVLGDESVLLNLSTERYFSLDDVGTRMWQLLSDHGAIEPVVAQLLTEYEADEETLKRDLTNLLGKLSQASLVTAA